MLPFSRISAALLLTLVTLLGCQSDDPAPVNETPNVQDATLLATGTFRTEVHATSGTVTLYQGPNGRQLVLENFRTDSGPALYVYLTKDRTANSIVDLGLLKSNSGTFSYPVPATIDYAAYPYVLIWCERFSVLFGSSQLMKP